MNPSKNCLNGIAKVRYRDYRAWRMYSNPEKKFYDQYDRFENSGHIAVCIFSRYICT
jgi:hypothetical protein